MTTYAPELVLHIQVSFSDPAKLRVDVRAENRSQHEIYWLNRFWTVVKGGQTAWDPRGPYRHEKGGVLRLLYGVAPVPSGTDVNNRYIPQATRIAPGAAAEEHTEIAVPVEEFALFEPPSAKTEYELVEVESVAVIAHYVAPGDGIVIAPSFVDPAYFWVKAPDQKVRVAEAIVAADRKIPVRRRKDEIARVLLSNEKP
ncbi:MAG: hypothetical protein ACMG6S_00460 [Byssovorax sp.]